MPRKKVLMFVFNDIMSDRRVQYSADALAEKYDVTLVAYCTKPGHLFHNFRLVTVSDGHYKKSKVFGHLHFWLTVFLEGIKGRYHVIWAHDFFMAFPGFLLSFLTRAKLVYDAHEISIPEKRVKKGLRGKIFYLLEIPAVKWSHVLVAASVERAKVMKKYYGLKKMPLVIQNIPSSAEFEAVRKSADIGGWKAKLDSRHGKVKIVYQGGLDLFRGISNFINAMTRLDDNFILYLIGRGGDEGALREEINRLGLSGRVFLLGYMPRNEMYALLPEFEIGIIAYTFDYLGNMLCAPNKLHEYAMAGLPILSTSQPPLKKALEAYQIGLTVRRETDPAKYALEIAGKIKAMAPNLKTYKNNLAKFLADNRWDDEKNKIIQAVDGLFNGRKS